MKTTTSMNMINTNIEQPRLARLRLGARVAALVGTCRVLGGGCQVVPPGGGFLATGLRLGTLATGGVTGIAIGLATVGLRTSFGLLGNDAATGVAVGITAPGALAPVGLRVAVGATRRRIAAGAALASGISSGGCGCAVTVVSLKTNPVTRPPSGSGSSGGTSSGWVPSGPNNSLSATPTTPSPSARP